MVNFYTDNHGERWGVMMQQKRNSCAVACTAMAEVYMKSQVTANMESIFRSLSQRFPESWNENRGASMDNVVQMLRYRGLHCYDSYDYGAGGVWPYLYAYANDNAPVITHIDWGVNKGAHAILCVHVYKSDQKCIFLDPFYGLVENTGSNLPTYTVGAAGFPVIATGKLSGWLIITKPW